MDTLPPTAPFKSIQGESSACHSREEVLNEECLEGPSQEFPEKTIAKEINEDGVDEKGGMMVKAWPMFDLALTNKRMSEQLDEQIEQNKTILTNLNLNFDELFRKMSELNEQLQADLPISAQELAEKEQEQQKISAINDSADSLIAKVLSLRSKIKANQPAVELSISNLQPLSIEVLSMRHFQTGKSLGYGKFGEVLQCKHLQTGHLLALKKIFKSTIDQFHMHEQLLFQLNVLHKIDHPNIARAFKAFTDDYHIFILMEYVPGVSLLKKFKSPERKIKPIIIQILKALQYLHSMGITHRDLKPENILLTYEGVIKICDFGWASEQEQMSIMCGTLDYVSPEMVGKVAYTNKVDLWNVGVLTYELIFGVAPFHASTQTATLEKVGKIEFEYPKNPPISIECRQFIDGLLQMEQKRCTLQNAINHPFLNKPKRSRTKHRKVNQ